MSAPTYVTYTILLSSIAIIVATLAGLRVAVTRAGWEEAQRIATLRVAAVVLPLWFVVALALSFGGSFSRQSRADHRVRHLHAGCHRLGVAVAI